MYVVYKYALSVAELQKVEIKGLVKLLTIQSQNDAPCLWALVDPEGWNAVTLEVQTVWTGAAVRCVREYFATCQIFGDSFVSHYFVDVVTGNIKDFL